MRDPLSESDVRNYVISYFEKEGWEMASSQEPLFQCDIVMVKGNRNYVIEAKGETKGGETHNICVAIGQIVARMRESEKHTNYGIAIPFLYARFLSKFGLKGWKALNLHLFIVNWIGWVWHLTPEKVAAYVKELEKGKDEPWLLRSQP